MARTFVRDHRSEEFLSQVHARIVKDGQMVKQKTWEETIPRDHQIGTRAESNSL